MRITLLAIFMLASIVSAQADIVINEIMYNSPGYDNEWIELYNMDYTSFSLEGFTMRDNDEAHSLLEFPTGASIPACGYYTIAIYHDSNAATFPFTPDYNATGICTWNLSNNSDVIYLFDADGNVWDEVGFFDTAPWPTAPDGNGPSLELINPILDNSLGVNWQASEADGGTPGAANSSMNIVDLTIGTDSTSANTLPLDYFWKNSLSETIYMADELVAGSITGSALTQIVYYYNFVDNLPGMPVNIWVGETDLTQVPSTWIPAGELTQVYSGTMDWVPGDNEAVFVLEQPYIYNGGNLVIMVNRPMDTAYYSGDDVFYYTDTPDFQGRSVTLYSNTNTFDPYNPPNSPNYLDRVPNTTFIFIEPEDSPEAAQNPYPDDESAEVPQSGSLTWEWGDDTVTYDLWFGPLGAMAEVVNGALCTGSTGSYTYSNLFSNTIYQWKVVAHNPFGSTSSDIWSFSTGEFPTVIISELVAAQRTDGSGIVDISYSLILIYINTINIVVQVSDDGGDTFTITPDPANLSGDVGAGVLPGEGKHIEWAAGNECYGLDGDCFRVKVSAVLSL